MAHLAFSSMMLLLAALALAFFAALIFTYTAYPKRLLDEARAASPNLRQGVRMVLLGRAAPLNDALLNEERRTSLKRRFVMMGRPDMRPVDFVAYLELSIVLFTVLVAAMVWMLKVSWVWVFVGLGFGVLYPFIWMRDQIKKRHLAITRALPYNLDLLTLAVEAGLDFASAVGTVVQRGRPGALNEELALMLNEIRMGKTREEALRNMSDRVGLSALQQFVGNLIQADKMGTSLGKVLRIQSGQMRIERTQRAEKLANEAPVKMLGPLILCIFPTVFIVLFGPIVYQLMEGL